MKITSRSHNPGIDIIRIVAMCMVVSMHVLMNNIEFIRLTCSPVARIAVRLFYVETFVCVNLFILATGWLYAGRTPKPHRLLELFCMVLFFDIGSRLLLCPITGQPFLWKRIIHEHWFWNAYLALILFVPILNGGLIEMNRRWGNAMVLRIVFFISFVLGIVPVHGIDNGRSFGWFLCLYLTGAQLHISSSLIEPPKAVRLFSAAILLPIFTSFLSMFFLSFFGLNLYWLLELYQSPILYVSSVSFFLSLATVDLPQLPKLVRFAATASFSVYLIHTASVVRPHFFALSKWMVEHAAQQGGGNVIIAVLATVLVVYAFGMVVELVRRFVFRFSRMDTACQNGGRLISSFLVKHR